MGRAAPRHALLWALAGLLLLGELAPARGRAASRALLQEEAEEDVDGVSASEMAGRPAGDAPPGAEAQAEAEAEAEAAPATPEPAVEPEAEPEETPAKAEEAGDQGKALEGDLEGGYLPGETTEVTQPAQEQPAAKAMQKGKKKGAKGPLGGVPGATPAKEGEGAAGEQPAEGEAGDQIGAADEGDEPPKPPKKGPKKAPRAAEDELVEGPEEDEELPPAAKGKAKAKKGPGGKALSKKKKKKKKPKKVLPAADDFVHTKIVEEAEEYAGPEQDDPADILPAEKDLDREQLAASKDCKIFVLDVSEMSQFLGFPACDVSRLATDPEFGTLLPNATHLRPGFNYTPPEAQYHSMYPYHALSHDHSLNAGPWFLSETLMRSPLRTDNIDEADVIFVNDYCRLMWALAEDHGSHHWWASTNLKNEKLGGPALTSAYNVMMQMKQWQEDNGRGFVFFQSHPGFQFGDENITRAFYDSVVCQNMGDSLHLVVERSQRWKCPNYKEGKFVIVPYSSSPDARAITEQPPELALKKPRDRKTLVFFRGNCGPWESVAKRFRHAIVGALKVANGSDVDACCLGEPKAPVLKCSKEEEFGGGTTLGWHKRMLEAMADSRFCMIVPGDTQSSERISDAFATGCIPVFIGAPFHAMPLAAHVDYEASTVFINLTDTRRWFGKEKPQWWLNPRHDGKHKGKLGDWWHPKWWTADAMGVEPIALKNVEQVVHYLREMSPEVADEKFENVLRQRNLFVYKHEPQSPPSASDVIIDSMCQYALGGYGEDGEPLNKFRETEESIERARRKRLEAERLSAEKEAALAADRRR